MKKIILLLLMSFFSFSSYSQLMEGFEAATAPDAAGNWNLGTAPTSGVWKVFDNGVGVLQSWGPIIAPPAPASLIHTGSRAADVQRGNIGQNNSSEDWLVTPLQNITSLKQLRFWTRQGLIGDQGTIYEVRISNNNPSAADQMNPAAFPTAIGTYTEQQLNQGVTFSDYNEKSINLTTFANTNRYIAFVRKYTQTGTGINGDRWLIDDVRIVDQCTDPTLLGASNFTATTAQIAWTGPSGASFEIEYGTSNFTQGTGTIVTSATPNYTLTELMPSTCYQYYVRAICGTAPNTVNSEWSGPFNFCTITLGSNCASAIPVTTLPYSDTSNTIIYGNNITNNTPGGTGCGVTGNYLNGNDVVYAYTAATTGNISITMIPGSTTSTGIFVYSSCANIGVSCLAGVGNNNSNIRDIPTLAVTAGSTYYIVLSSSVANASYDYTLIIQNVACAAPINLVAANIGLNDATLSWQNGTGGTSTSFQVAVQPAGSPIPSAAGFTVAGTTVSAALANGAPLAAGTAYQFWVRADCGDGQTFSTWSGPFLFNTTICALANQCNYNFTISATSGGFGNARFQVRQNGIVVATLGPQLTTGNGPVTVVVPLCTGVPFDLFWLTGGTNAANVRVSITNNFNQPIYAMTTNSAPLVGTVLYSQANVDCANPLCTAPTGLTITNITTMGATLNFAQSINTTTGYNIYVVPVGSPAPNAGTAPTYTVTSPPAPPVTIPTAGGPALNTDTAYSVYIQSICSANSPSNWTTTPVNFTTLATCPRVTNVLVPAATINTTDAVVTFTPGTPSQSLWQYALVPAPSTVPPAFDSPLWTNTTSTTINLTGLTAATAYVIYIRPVCSPTDIGSPQIPGTTFQTGACDAAQGCSYTFRLRDSFGDGWNGAIMEVRQNGLLIATFGPNFTNGAGPIDVVVPVCDGLPLELKWTVGGTFANEVSVEIINSFNQSIFLMPFNNAALAGTVLYAAPVNCLTPQCLPPTAVTVVAGSITPTTATINWTPSPNGGTTNGWNVYFVLTGSPAPTPATTPNFVVPSSTPPPFLVTGLSPDTAYTIYVSSNCTGGTTVGPFPSVPVTTLPTCPRVTNVQVPEPTIGITTATVTFTPGLPSQTLWQYAVVASPSTGPPATDSPLWINTSTTTINLTGLTAATCYVIYIRAICDGGADIGQAQSPGTTFCTAICEAVDRCNYTFRMRDSFGDGWNGARMEIRQNGILVATIGATFTAGNGPIDIIVPLCNNLPFELKWTVAGTFPTEVGVEVINSFNQSLYTMPFQSAALATTVLYTGVVDCINPTCIAPVSGVTLVANSVTTTSATVTWVAPLPPATGINLYVVPAGSGVPLPGAIPTVTLPNGTTTPYVITGLVPDTDYCVYISSVCAAGALEISPIKACFTTLPTCPRPTGLVQLAPIGPGNATLSWTPGAAETQWVIYIAPGTGNPVPTTGGIPVSSPNAPPYITSTLSGGVYEFWVQAVCSATDSSTPAGPQTFFITTVPEVCAGVNINLNTSTPGQLDLCPSAPCTDLTATYTDSGDTTTYEIQPIAFAPPFPFTGGIQLAINTDDIWGEAFTLPFNFCFFGTNYATVNVGSNGVITFNPQPNNGYCPWNTDPNVTVPNTAFPILNAIYGVYQDINPNVSTGAILHSINYQVVGVAPCRAFVVNFYNIPQFGCNLSVGLQTSQIVLYETSNAIEVYVQDRTVCTTWNEGSGVIGIQNAAGTVGFVPPGRQLGPWEAHNEAWRFQPAGPSNVTFGWYQGTTLISNETTINVCVTEATTYTAQATYNLCGGSQTITTANVIITLDGAVADDLEDVTGCAYVLEDLSANNSYYSLPGGPSGGGILYDPGTVITTTQTIYVFAQVGDCIAESDFLVTIVGSIVPTFDPVPNPCVNGPAPALPTVSTNGTPISGTWSGVVSTAVAGTFSFTFTPDITLFPCAAPVTIEIIVEDQIVPTFDPIGPFCINSVPGPVLPTQSTNVEGPITGTFAPNVIDTSVAGTFDIVFTPDAALFPCATTATITYVVTDQIVPTFDPIADICQGETNVPVLMTNNNVAGTFDPPVISTDVAGTFVFTFTPDPTNGQCSVAGSVSVNILPSITPTFDPITSICQNTVAPVLPTTSNNGVMGTWSPATIDTSALGCTDYTFTPDADASQPCADPITISICITTPKTPDFSFPSFCANTPAPILTNSSPNEVTGTWNPLVVDDTMTGTYTFTPDAGQCAVPQTVTIVVNPSIVPVFTTPAPFCEGTTAPAFPTDNNGVVTGTWSAAVISNTASGTYTFTPDPQFCSQPVTITVTVNPSITPTFDPIAPICAGDSAPVLPAASLEGIPGTFSPTTVSNTQTGTYTFTPTSTANCETTAEVTVTVIDKPRFRIDGQCQGGVYQLSAVPLDSPSNYSESGVTYSWTGPDGNQIASSSASISASVPGTYTLTISAGNCADSQSQSAVSCTIQRGISPKGINSGDGLNDFFDLAGQGVGKLEIFNRYGTKVYTKVNYNNEWYGQSDKGDELPDATYFYVIEYSNGTASKTGWIYINREQ